MGFVRDLLLFLHLLGMATLVGAFLLQLRVGLAGPLTPAWLHGGALQLVTGVALQLLAPVTDAEYNNAKLGVKLLVLIVIGALALFYTIRGPAKRWVPLTLISLVIINVGLAVFWD